MAVTTSRDIIDRFLSSKRIAFIGISQNTRDFSRHLFREFANRGYDVVPVHPRMIETEERVCYPRVGAIKPGVDAAIIMTAATHSEGIVRECAAAGIQRVWLYRAVGQGAVSEAAVAACREAGIEVVAGECPFMFMDGSGFPHNLHACVRKLLGSFPVAAERVA
jgi:uncharacterized protein